MERGLAGDVSGLAQPTEVIKNTSPKQPQTHDPAKTMNDLSRLMQDNVD